MTVPRDRCWFLAFGFWLLLFIIAAPAAQQVSTAKLSGVVTNGDATPQPVRRAIVRLSGQGAEGRSAITDDQGRFAFTGLPAGRFTLTASKPAHLTNAYGAKEPGRPGTAVTVGAGQSVADLRITLPRGAVISGTIRDRSGEPASAVTVSVLRLDGSRNATATTPPEAITDDRGMFRLFGLMPGTYAVAASPRVASLTGGVRVLSTSDVDAAFREQQQRTGAVAASPAISSTPSRASATYAYAPVFYPGTPVATEATQISVRAGEDRDGVDFSLDFVPVVNVEGTVSAPGDLPEINVTMTADGPQMGSIFTTRPSLEGRPGVDGKNAFRFTNVTPGHYVVLARSSYSRTVTNGASISSTAIDPATVASLWGSAEIDVRGEPISSLSIQLQPSMTFAGRVAFNATSLAAPQNLTSIRVTLTPDPATPSPMMTGLRLAPNGGVRADGTFQIYGVIPGSYRLTATIAAAGPAGWWLRSATSDRRDLLDAGVEITPGNSLGDVVITFSDRHSELSGTLQTAAGQSAPEYVVAVFPADRSMWRLGARRLKTSRPGSDGRFAFADLPPGDYVLAALTDATDDDWQTPAVLEELLKTGVKVTLGEAEKKTQNLQLGR